MRRSLLVRTLLSAGVVSLIGACASREHAPRPLVEELGQGAASTLTIVRELDGPERTSGIASVESLGAVNLVEEFPAMGGHHLRARVFTINPGGVVARHEHNARPGYAYVLSGEIVEHRNDREGPVTRHVGDVALEQTGVVHWWENTSDQPVRVLVVDIYKVEEKS